MELGLVTFAIVGGYMIWEAIRPEKKKTPEEKLGEALTGYLKIFDRKVSSHAG